MCIIILARFEWRKTFARLPEETGCLRANNDAAVAELADAHV